MVSPQTLAHPAAVLALLHICSAHGTSAVGKPLPAIPARFQRANSTWNVQECPREQPTSMPACPDRKAGSQKGSCVAQHCRTTRALHGDPPDGGIQLFPHRQKPTGAFCESKSSNIWVSCHCSFASNPVQTAALHTSDMFWPFGALWLPNIKTGIYDSIVTLLGTAFALKLPPLYRCHQSPTHGTGPSLHLVFYCCILRECRNA